MTFSILFGFQVIWEDILGIFCVMFVVLNLFAMSRRAVACVCHGVSIFRTNQGVYRGIICVQVWCSFVLVTFLRPYRPHRDLFSWPFTAFHRHSGKLANRLFPLFSSRPVHEVFLWNTNGPTDVIFPDEFLKRGYAVMADDETKVNDVEASFVPCPVELPMPDVAQALVVDAGKPRKNMGNGLTFCVVIDIGRSFMTVVHRLNSPSPFPRHRSVRFSGPARYSSPIAAAPASATGLRLLPRGIRWPGHRGRHPR